MHAILHFRLNFLNFHKKRKNGHISFIWSSDEAAVKPERAG